MTDADDGTTRADGGTTDPANTRADDGTGVGSPADAFALLGDGTRLDVLRELWAAGGPVAYADLMRRAGVADSGRFNYHLDRLTGHFVRETDGGYALRTAGAQVVRAVLAGALTEDPSFGPVEVGADCPHCGSPLSAAYADEHLVVRCTAGEGWPVAAFDLPPAAVAGASPAAVFEVAPSWYTAKVRPMIRGICPECARETALTVHVCDDHAIAGDHACRRCGTPYLVDAEYACGHCRYTRRFPLYHHFHTHPDVVAFYREHGVDLDRWSWDDADRLFAYDEAVVGDDPLAVAVTTDLDGDRCRLTFDANLAITDVRAVGGD